MSTEITKLIGLIWSGRFARVWRGHSWLMGPTKKYDQIGVVDFK